MQLPDNNTLFRTAAVKKDIMEFLLDVNTAS